MSWTTVGLAGVVWFTSNLTIARQSQPNDERISLPSASEIREMRVDVYSSGGPKEPDLFNFVVPQEKYDQILAHFRHATKHTFRDGGFEMGRVTIKEKEFGRTRTIIFYFLGKVQPGAFHFTLGSTQYVCTELAKLPSEPPEETIRRIIRDGQKK